MKFIKRLFRCPQDRNLILVWRQEDLYGGGQTETETKIMVGRHTILRWTTIFTPANTFD